jgi:hypothetical protein
MLHTYNFTLTFPSFRFGEAIRNMDSTQPVLKYRKILKIDVWTAGRRVFRILIQYQTEPPSLPHTCCSFADSELHVKCIKCNGHNS